ncbi:hypothetical protein Rhopal_004130-T1 [Rhodotorula paludigena]|uniref:Golgi apparatus membrane protein TVP38 n=1 Tax=Rhodotorula paludigena TaxID=86838 RepID=A0AAV5GNN6_9BASI|nr:hypothetical protein Rhopal_004130-T1 [Rhodotorula paludigena]
MGLRRWCRNEWAEAKEAGIEIWHFARTHDWKKSARKAFARKYWIWWIITIILTVCILLLSIYRDWIVEKFEPHKDAIADNKWSWVIPIVVLIILSIPPLGGHEIVLLVVGLIWGMWIGFGLAAAGTFIGEILCFWLFKYFFTGYAVKIEQSSIFYACIARLMRNGGIWIIIIIRFSAVPGHVVTAVQSTVGMSIWIYSIAVLVSMPKQLVLVVLGHMFTVNADTSTPQEVRNQKIISWSVLVGTGIATMVSLYIVYMRARKLYPEVLRDMEEAAASKTPLSSGDSSAPTIPTSHPYAPKRRSSLVEAAFAGDPAPGVASGGSRDEYLAPSNRGSRAHGMRRTNTGGTYGGIRDEYDDGADEDDWDHKSPAMRGAGESAAWQDGPGRDERERRAVRDVVTLGYQHPYPAGGGVGQGQEQDDPDKSYTHLPLASESEVAYGAPPYGSDAPRPVRVEAPPQGPLSEGIPYVPSGSSAQQQQPAQRGTAGPGQYGAMDGTR